MAFILNHPTFCKLFLIKNNDYIGMEELYHQSLSWDGTKSSIEGINTKQTKDGLVKLIVIALLLYSGTVSEGKLLN